MSDLADRLTVGFAKAFGGAPSSAFRAPGRVNLIGEHTDYNDGFALPIAIGAETRVAVRPRSGAELHVAALDYGETDAFVPAAGLARHPSGGWRDYVRGTAAMLAHAGVAIPGGEIAIAGDIPKGTGLSSSASLEVGVATALLALAGEERDPVELALIAQRAENDFVGMRCGNLDQLSAAATRAGAALLIDCRSLALTPVPMPADAAVMIVQSGVERGLVDGEYNLRRAECEEAASVLGVPALRDADLAALDATADRMRPVVHRRARHIITENIRVLRAVDALAAGDLASFGALLRKAHASQRDDFGITVAATDALTAVLDEAIGDAGGARQTGGGFGGAVIAVLPVDRVEAVVEAVLRNYRSPAGYLPDIRLERAAAGAGAVPADLA